MKVDHTDVQGTDDPKVMSRTSACSCSCRPLRRLQ